MVRTTPINRSRKGRLSMQQRVDSPRMDPSTVMRLRLIVCRNDLPDAQVVWPVSLDSNPTIAKLLEQISDIFPLESGEWGLEDYAVELTDANGSSFECLHFQPVASILKEDDQVLIRPLQTDDVRRRRASGRMQITSDGKHLIDGIAYGRPLLRAPRTRPSLTIPPRKRRRIALEEDEAVAEEEADENYDDQEDWEGFEGHPDGSQLRLTYGEDAEEDEEESGDAMDNEADSDEDSDEQMIEDEDLAQELKDLEEEEATRVHEEAAMGVSSRKKSRRQTSRQMRSANQPLPNGVSSGASLLSFGPFGPSSQGSSLQGLANDPWKDPKSSFVVQGSLTAEVDDDDHEEVPDSVKKFDHKGFPAGSILLGAAAGPGTHTKFGDTGAEKTARAKVFSDAVKDIADTSSDEDSSDEDQSSSDESASEYDDDDDESSSSAPSSSDEEDGDGSDSDRGSDDNPQAAGDDDHTSHLPGLTQDHEDGSSSVSDSGPEETSVRQRDSMSQQVLSKTSQGVPPGSGKTATKKRNQRRRLAQKMQRAVTQAQGNGDVVSGTTGAQPIDPVSFEARRRALLEAIASGGVEVGPGSFLDLETPSAQTEKITKRKHGVPEVVNNAEDRSTGGPEITDTMTPPSAQKRRRVDLDPGRRMIFSALGLKNPKTKEDELELRASLMQDVRPTVNHRLAREDKSEVVAQSPALDDPEDWRDKIVYRAVECCRDGVDLSEPPFPFVQRWDPQQQQGRHYKKNKRGGAGKRALRDQEQYYQGGYQKDNRRSGHKQVAEDEEFIEDSYVDKARGVSQDENIVLNYDDEEPAQDNTYMEDADDLPALPSDLTTLADAALHDVQTGMVLAWKQLIMSKATNWQPLVRDFRGKVTQVEHEAAKVHVSLAQEDRNLDRTEKKYDGATGKRIYDKFEAPESEDEEDEGMDDGLRTLGYAEMIEPKILRSSPTMHDTEAGSVEQAVTGDGQGDSSTTIQSQPSSSDQQDGQNVQASEISAQLLEISSPSRQILTETTSHPSASTLPSAAEAVMVMGSKDADAPQDGSIVADSYADGSPLKDVESQVLSQAASSVESGRQPDYMLNTDLPSLEHDSLRSLDGGHDFPAAGIDVS